jgi:hypothetical protein
MICPQILGRHGACGHEATEGSRVGVRCVGHGGESHEVCKEGGNCGKGVESDAGGSAQGVRTRMERMHDGDGSRGVIAMELGSVYSASLLKWVLVLISTNRIARNY